ncbi:aquaporin-like protein, partial [Massariosphaeria phaeospora]
MKPTYTSDPRRQGEKRMPGCGWLPNRVRYMVVSMLGEFVGTFLFLFFAFAATQVANNLHTPGRNDFLPDTSRLLYIALAFGFSLAVNVWVFFRISGGLFNPAVTVALALVGAVGWLKAGLLIISQILGAIAAAGLASGLFPSRLAVRTTLHPTCSATRGLFIEMFLTALLIFTIFMLAAEKHKATFLAPIGIGLALFVAELAGVYWTGGSLNPARSFGPDVVLGKFDRYHWIYWIGPLLGALLAVLFYRLIKLLEYETANPGADGDGHEARYAESAPDTPRRTSKFQIFSQHTDGTDDTAFLPPNRPINGPLPSRSSSWSRYTTANVGTGVGSLPAHPLPTLQHGSDGHYSERSPIDHPNDRPRAQHRRSSLSSRSQYEIASEHSYRSGPSTESGSS